MRTIGLVVALGLLAPAAFAQALVNDGKPLPLEIQAKHANGLIVQLSGIQAGLSETVITAQLVNGHRKKIALAHTPRSTFLQIPTGERFALSPPENNERLELEGRTKLEGELVFLGRLPEVDKVTLVINDDFGSAEDFANLPRLVIPIPLQPAAYTGESKKKLKSRFEAAPVRTSIGVVLSIPRSTLVGAAIPVSRNVVAGIAVSRTERGLALALPGDILFDFDRADLRASALPMLTELAALIRADRPKRVRIEGHTDAMGSEAYNLELGRRRAEAVRDHLVRRHRLEAALFTVESFGESRPVAPNAHPDGRDDPEGRQKNRRVEVLLD